MALARELLGLLGQPRLFVGRVLQLRVVADDDLFLFVMLGVQRGDRVRRVRDGALERRGFLRERDERVALGCDAVAQLLDLALGLENPARFGAAAARHQLRAAEDVAVQRWRPAAT